MEALGSARRRDLGVQTIPLDSIVGTVDRKRAEFDRSFRPMTGELRDRWQRVAAARRSGVALAADRGLPRRRPALRRGRPPRVSVARALGDDVIEARVREISTSVGASPDLRSSELPLKQHERIFFERVPLRPDLRHRVELTDEWRYAQLATLVEARGYRESHARGRLISREELAELWYHDQFEPIVAAMREAVIGGPGTDADRYLRFVMLRFLLLFTTDWSDGVIERLIGEVRPPRPEDDTLVHQILTEMHSGPSPRRMRRRNASPRARRRSPRGSAHPRAAAADQQQLADDRRHGRGGGGQDAALRLREMDDTGGDVAVQPPGHGAGVAARGGERRDHGDPVAGGHERAHALVVGDLIAGRRSGSKPRSCASSVSWSRPGVQREPTISSSRRLPTVSPSRSASRCPSGRIATYGSSASLLSVTPSSEQTRRLR